MRRRLLGLAVLAACPLAGCQTSGWQRYYTQGLQVAAVPFTPREQVQVRTVTMQQMNDAAAVTQQYLDERKLAAEDATAEDARARRRLLLDALRVREDANEITIVGSSSFTGPAPASPDEDGLKSFANRIGADIVVIASEYAGERQGYTTVPVFSSSTASASANAWGSNGWAQGTATGYGTTTTYVPVPVTYQQWGNVGIFFRRVTPAERALLDEAYPKAK